MLEPAADCQPSPEHSYESVPEELLQSDPSGRRLWLVDNVASNVERDIWYLTRALDYGQHSAMVKLMVSLDNELHAMRESIGDFRNGLMAGSGYHYLPERPFTPAHLAYIEELAKRRGFPDMASAIEEGERTHYMGIDAPRSLDELTRRDLEQLEQWLTYWIEDESEAPAVADEG